MLFYLHPNNMVLNFTEYYWILKLSLKIREFYWILNVQNSERPEFSIYEFVQREFILSNLTSGFNCLKIVWSLERCHL